MHVSHSYGWFLLYVEHMRDANGVLCWNACNAYRTGPHDHSQQAIVATALLSLAYQSSSTSVQVCRGTAVMMVSPTSGTKEIANPFGQDE